MSAPSIPGTLVALCLLAGCTAVPSVEERQRHADELAAAQGWRVERMRAGDFELLAYLPTRIAPGSTLTIYLEGDGFAWRSRSQPSDDPTPIDALGLRLALAQPAGNVAYLARPCQFPAPAAAECAQRYWTYARFAAEVIDATDDAVDRLKTRFAARQLVLVGYSGGAAVAALLAARRADVGQLISVAGNLDTDAWTQHHRVSPLRGSLNPAHGDFRPGMRQWHFVGGRDRIIPAALVQAFAGRFAAGQRPLVHVEPDYDHHCCWVDDWPRLWNMAAESDDR